MLAVSDSTKTTMSTIMTFDNDAAFRSVEIGLVQSSVMVYGKYNDRTLFAVGRQVCTVRMCMVHNNFGSQNRSIELESGAV